MEGLGAAASIIQLVTFAGQVVSEVRRYSKSVKNYPQTAAQLLEQLENMGRVLGDLSILITPPQLQSSNPGAQRPAHDAPTLNNLIGNTVRRCEKALQDLQEKIRAEQPSKPESRLKKWSSGFRKKLLWPFTEEETKGLIAAFGAHERQFLIAISSATYRKVNVMEEHTKAEQLRLLRKWVSAVDYTSKYSRSVAIRNRKTGSWLLSDPKFTDWQTRKANSQIFWLNGIPGCGKTMLTSMVIEQVMPVDPDTVGAYFYCDGTDATTIDASNILRSVLLQLLLHNTNKTKPLIARLQELRVAGEILPPHPTQLQELIVEAASYYTEGTVVIDAVDECGRDAKEELLPCLTYIVEKVPSLQLFVSSRDEYDIRDNLMPGSIDYSLVAGSPALSLREDIKIYIQDEFDRKPRLRRLKTTLKFQISETMLGSDNMFRWVQCQVENITKCRSEEEIHDTLANLPASLNETYERALDRITHKTDILLARHTFGWLIGAKRPLTLSEVAGALNIAENEGPKTLLEEEELLDICGSLIGFDATTNVIRFSHITVQEFLLSGHLAKSERTHFSFCIADLEYNLTLASLRYLLSQDLNVDENGSSYGKHPDRTWFSLDPNGLRKQYKARPLLLYAARYWTRHLKHASPPADDLLYSLVIRLFTAPENFGSYCSLLQARFVKDDPQIFVDPNGPAPPRTHIRKKSIMYYLIQSGANWLIRRAAEEHPAWVDELDWGYGHGTPMMLAIKHGNVEMVRVLLDLGANPNKISASDSGIPTWHPIHYAVTMQNPEIFQLLISRGANVNLRYRPARNQTALHLATQAGATNMVKTMLEAGAYPSPINNEGDSPLWAAVDRNSLDIVRFLVESGVEIDVFGTRHAPLWHALALRSPPMVEYLFSKAGCGSGQIIQEIHEQDFLWAHDQPWHGKLVPHLTQRRDYLLGSNESRAFLPTKTDVYHILWIMRQLLKNGDPSKPIAARILDRAEIWIPETASRNETAIISETLEQLQPYETHQYPRRMELREESRANLHPYVTLTLPRGLKERVIRQIIFRTQSHDQGKVGVPVPHDGYGLRGNTGTGTWLEATIVGDCPHRSFVYVIHQNLPGVAAGRVHTNVWDLSEKTSGTVRNWLTRPRGGVKIGVYPRAYFEGWVNQVESVEIEVRYAVGGDDVQSPMPMYSLGPSLDVLGL